METADSAGNFYVISIYDFQEEEDIVDWKVRFTTYSDDEGAAQKILAVDVTRKDEMLKWIDSKIETGRKYDRALSGLFQEVPQKEVYLHLVGESGKQTIVDFINVPLVQNDMLATYMEQVLLKEDWKRVKIVYPSQYGRELEMMPQATSSYTSTRPKEKKFFSYGSTNEEVLRIQGIPDKKEGKVWFYGYSFVAFDEKNKVRDIFDFRETLKFVEK